MWVVSVGYTGYLKVELVKPDGTRETLFTGSKQGSGMQTFTGTKSLGGLTPGNYRIVVSIKTSNTFHDSYNNILKVTLTSKRVCQTSSALQATPFNAGFDIQKVTLNGTVTTDTDTSVSWSFSADGGTACSPLSLTIRCIWRRRHGRLSSRRR